MREDTAAGIYEQHPALVATLQLAVPLAIDEMIPWPPRRRTEATRNAAEIIGSKGDILLYGGTKKRGAVAEVFTELARALAALAFAPGGVTFAGLHWCVYSHPWCPRRHGARFRRPPCCTCEPTRCCASTVACPQAQRGHICCGTADGCPWCRNGCAVPTGGLCCKPGTPSC